MTASKGDGVQGWQHRLLRVGPPAPQVWGEAAGGQWLLGCLGRAQDSTAAHAVQTTARTIRGTPRVGLTEGSVWRVGQCLLPGGAAEHGRITGEQGTVEEWPGMGWLLALVKEDR